MNECLCCPNHNWTGRRRRMIRWHVRVCLCLSELSCFFLVKKAKGNDGTAALAPAPPSSSPNAIFFSFLLLLLSLSFFLGAIFVPAVSAAAALRQKSSGGGCCTHFALRQQRQRTISSRSFPADQKAPFTFYLNVEVFISAYLVCLFADAAAAAGGGSILFLLSSYYYSPF